MVFNRLWLSHVDDILGYKENKEVKFKLIPVECKYHELAKQVNKTRCVACGKFFKESKK